MHTQQGYFIYLHERDDYDLYHFSEVLRSVSKHYIIDFEEEAPLLAFLEAIKDGQYPARIIIDLYEVQQVKAILGKLRQHKDWPLLPVLVLRDRKEDIQAYENVELFSRPKNTVGWKALVQKIIS